MQIPIFSEKHQVCFEWIPVNLPKLLNQSGNTSPAMIKNKAIYSLKDLKRWADYLELPFKMIRPGSFDSRPALRIAAALEGETRSRLCLALFEAIWSGDIDPRKEDWLLQVLTLKKLPKTWINLCHDVLNENSEKALKAGAFGVPTFILHRGDCEGQTRRAEMFFGVDHIDFLARACK